MQIQKVEGAREEEKKRNGRERGRERERERGRENETMRIFPRVKTQEKERREKKED